jgi:DHA1 family inner membrane transport protein
VAGAMLAAGLFPIYAVLVIALFCAGMGRGIYDPALQAFTGQNVPYAYRGRVIGLIEMSWSASALIGIPLVGLLIERQGWRSPFLVLGMTCLGLMLLMGALIPAHAGRKPKVGLAGDMLQRWQQLFHTPRAVGMLLFAFAINMANDVLFVVYGVWLEGSFGLTVVALGGTTIVIGVAELGGVGRTVLLADRIGLGRAVTGSLALSALAYALFPFFASNLNMALASLFMVFLIFEFNIVSAISLFTEILPDARATMMSGYKAAAGMGRVVGALIGIPILLATGIIGVGLTAGGICLLGLVALVWALRRWREDEGAATSAAIPVDNR